MSALSAPAAAVQQPAAAHSNPSSFLEELANASGLQVKAKEFFAQHQMFLVVKTASLDGLRTCNHGLSAEKVHQEALQILRSCIPTYFSIEEDRLVTLIDYTFRNQFIDLLNPVVRKLTSFPKNADQTMQSFAPFLSHLPNFNDCVQTIQSIQRIALSDFQDQHQSLYALQTLLSTQSKNLITALSEIFKFLKNLKIALPEPEMDPSGAVKHYGLLKSLIRQILKSQEEGLSPDAPPPGGPSASVENGPASAGAQANGAGSASSASSASSAASASDSKQNHKSGQKD